MGKYVRAQRVDAEQIEFTDEAKTAVKGGTPTTAYGGHIKFEDGAFSVPIHLGEDAKLANEGDWVVKEEGTGKVLIVSNEQFEEDYFEEEEDDFEDADNEVSEPAGEDEKLEDKKEDTPGKEKDPETIEPPVEIPAEPVIETPATVEIPVVDPVVEPAAEEGKAE